MPYLKTWNGGKIGKASGNEGKTELVYEAPGETEETESTSEEESQ